AYETAIARWFGDVEGFPETLALAFTKVADLRYGENPHQRAAYYSEDGARVHLLSRVEQLHGKELSLINLLDLSAARLMLREYTRVLGGLLVQDRDADIDDREGMRVACGEPDEKTWGDLVFAWRVCKHVGSNAIVIAKDLATIGIGSGQTSRVDAVKIALEKAREHGHDVEGAVLASDAFFPFPDGPKAALEAGVTAIIQPGGS